VDILGKFSLLRELETRHNGDGKDQSNGRNHVLYQFDSGVFLDRHDASFRLFWKTVWLGDVVEIEEGLQR
jgi:hypothetical protein